MPNDDVTQHDRLPVDELADLRGEIADLTERAHVLSLERGITLRMRHRAMVNLHRRGGTVEEIALLTGLSAGNVQELIQNPPGTARP